MSVELWNVEWLNHNAQRNYPLADDAEPVDTSNSFTIPDDFIVALDLPIHAGLSVLPARFFVKSIGSYATGYSVIIGYQPEAGDPVDVAIAMIARQAHQENTQYALGGVGDYADTVGKITIGNLINIDKEPSGFWTFAWENTRLDTDAVRPMIRGVSSIACANGTQTSARFYGDIVLRAGANVQFVLISSPGQPTIIEVNFIEGEGTIDDCVCEGDSALGDPIKTILRIQPTPDGNFNVIGSEAIQIEEIEHGIKVVNTRATPCCGCPELTRITEDLERLLQEKTAVANFVDDLRVSVNTMNMIVLGSKLGDTSCS